MFPPPTRRPLWLLVFLALAVAVVGAGVTVQADPEAPPTIMPYDPLHRW